MLNPPNQTNFVQKTNPIKQMAVKIQQKVQPNTADNVPPPPHLDPAISTSADTKVLPAPAAVSGEKDKQTTVVVSNETASKSVLKK